MIKCICKYIYIQKRWCQGPSIEGIGTNERFTGFVISIESEFQNRKTETKDFVEVPLFPFSIRKPHYNVMKSGVLIWNPLS